MATFDLSVLFFLQLAAILIACRLCGLVFKHFGQPQVVAEMIAGVLLGPSLLGWLAPAASAYLFPPESKPILFSVCQLGLVLYMFLIGVEFDFALIRSRLRSAATVSMAGIVVPFVLGGLIAWRWSADTTLFPQKTTATQVMLFMGAAMSITAFPMLARIIFEQGLSRTSLGTLALAAGSIDDVAAWCVLALVLASFQADPRIALLAIGGGVLFALFCLLVLRRLLLPLARQVESTGTMEPGLLVSMLILLMLGAWFTDSIQIYAVFGAFLTGLAMPRGKFAAELHSHLYPLTTALLLPCFFVYSGLNTKVDLLNTPALWLLAAVVTVMVLMAVVTTLMATPIFQSVYGSPARRAMLGALP